MLSRFKIFPYNRGSKSAKALASNLGVLRVGHNYDARRRDIIINWGSSNAYSIPFNNNDLNKPSAISIACNKLKTFKVLSEANFTDIPKWCTTRQEADEMLYNATNAGETLGKESIYCRTKLTGHSGQGIIIAKNQFELIEAPLYTLGTKHKHEFRVHVFNGEAIDVQQKKRKRDWAGPYTGIRNHSNGYVYCRADLVYPEHMVDKCVEAVKILGLDFAAVDVGYREYDDKVFVFEINTAPGLVGTTLIKYTQAFNNYLYKVNYG